jgi:hypothetical protein
MSEIIRANITRAGVTNPIAKNIIFQLDKQEAPEVTTYLGSDPHFSYKAYTVMLPMGNPVFILFRDYMIDQDVIDPITNTNRTYLIVSDPEMHSLDGHWEWICERTRGT